MTALIQTLQSKRDFNVSYCSNVIAKSFKNFIFVFIACHRRQFHIHIFLISLRPQCDVIIFPWLLPGCPQLLAYALKVLWQSVTLFCALLFKRRSHHVVVQNPPAIPTLAVCWFYSVLASANYVIDWHNYAHTIMALKLGPRHRLVRITEWFEGYFGKKARSNLCVTIAMKDDLQKKWGIT